MNICFAADHVVKLHVIGIVVVQRHEQGGLRRTEVNLSIEDDRLGLRNLPGVLEDSNSGERDRGHDVLSKLG